MSATYTVDRVFDDPYKFTTQKGHALVTYRLFISDGHDEKLVEWTRQADSPAPKPGEQITGDYEEVGTYKSGRPKLKFKLAQKGEPQQGNGASGTQQTFTDARSLRIERQHSQEMALRALAQRPTTEGDFKDAIRHWTDFFNADLDNYERARAGLPPKEDELADRLKQEFDATEEGARPHPLTSVADEPPF